MQGFEGQALAERLAEVCAAHSRVVPAESYSALDSPDERLRAIALLQQKAHSLEAEIAVRKRTEQALSESEAALSRALRLRDEFLSDISHDLKTPITVLLGQAQVLQRRATRGALDQGTLLKGLKQIEAKSYEMARLIDELLELTQVRAE
jgi:signal transduction histidine kinase